MRTRTELLRFFVVVMLAMGAAPASAALTVGLLPSSLVFQPGDTVTLEALVAGRGAGADQAIAAFDLNIGYDAALLTPTAMSFGAFLGDTTTQAFTDFSFATPGIVNFAEVSLLTGSELDLLQPSAFALARFSFLALDDGLASFNYVGEIRIDNADGIKLIDEPGTLGLLALALIGLLRVPCRRRWAGPDPHRRPPATLSGG